MKKNEIEKVEKKMTLSEYENKYSKRQYTKLARNLSTLVAALIGVVIFACLFMICMKAYDINIYFFYASIVLSVFVYIFVYIVPLIKLKKTEYFEVNVNKYNARQAKKHNKALREKIADKMIEFSQSTDGVAWYNSELIGKLAIARNMKNDSDLKKYLTEIYDKDVKKTANSIIRDHAIKVGVTTAISQSERFDTLFVVAYELNLIKDIVFLYGYRPSDAKLWKIYAVVLKNALLSYGIQSTTSNLASGIVQKIGGVVSSIPLLGSAISTVISSASQGIINAAMTVVIGAQTKKYLQDEYHLQDILDNINLEDEITEAEMIDEVKEEIIKSTKDIKKKDKNLDKEMA